MSDTDTIVPEDSAVWSPEQLNQGDDLGPQPSITDLTQPAPSSNPAGTPSESFAPDDRSFWNQMQEPPHFASAFPDEVAQQNALFGLDQQIEHPSDSLLVGPNHSGGSPPSGNLDTSMPPELSVAPSVVPLSSPPPTVAPKAAPLPHAADPETQQETHQYFNWLFNDPAAARQFQQQPAAQAIDKLGPEPLADFYDAANTAYLSALSSLPARGINGRLLQSAYIRSRDLDLTVGKPLFQHIGEEIQDREDVNAGVAKFDDAVAHAKFDEMRGGQPVDPEAFIRQYIEANPALAKSPDQQMLLGSLAARYQAGSAWMKEKGPLVQSMSEILHDPSQHEPDPTQTNAFATQVGNWPAKDQDRALRLLDADVAARPQVKAYWMRLLEQPLRRVGGVVGSAARIGEEIRLEEGRKVWQRGEQSDTARQKIAEINDRLAQLAFERRLEAHLNNADNLSDKGEGLGRALGDAGLGVAGEVPVLLLNGLKGVGPVLTAGALSLEETNKMKLKYPQMSTESAMVWGTLKGTLHTLLLGPKVKGVRMRYPKTEAFLNRLNRLPYLGKLAARVGLNAAVIHGVTELDMLIDPVVDGLATLMGDHTEGYDAREAFGQAMGLDAQEKAALSTAIFTGGGAAAKLLGGLLRPLVKAVYSRLRAGRVETKGDDGPRGEIKIEKPADWYKVFGKSAEVTREGDSVKEVLGRDLTDEELTQLAGATLDAKVKVTGSTLGTPSLEFKVKSKYVVEQTRILKREVDGTLVLQNYLFKGKDDNIRGFGTHSLGMQVRAAKKLKIDHIDTLAFRSDGASKWVGHYVWARLGFDGELSLEEISDLPAWLSSSRTISDIVKTPDGQKWWKENGYSKSLTFDLKNKSESIKTLSRYIKESNYRIHLHD